MKFYALTFANHTTLIMKSDLSLVPALKLILASIGLSWHGVIYNPESFLTLSPIHIADENQKRVAQDLYNCLIWKN